MLVYFYLETTTKSTDSLLAFNQKLKSYFTTHQKSPAFFPHNSELSLVPTGACIILSLDLHLEENIHYCEEKKVAAC